MAVHQLLFNSYNTPDLTLGDELASVLSSGLTLRKTDGPGGGYDVVGTYYETDNIHTTPWSPTELGEWFGFCVVPGIGSAGGPLFRLSNDGGATWLWWDGVQWSTPSAASHWNTEDGVAMNCGTFPLQASLSFQIKLTPTSDNRTPVVLALLLFCEFQYEFYTNGVRSLLRWLQGNLAIKQVYKETVASKSLLTVLSELPLVDDFKVFNLDADPNKRDPLSATRSGQDIQLGSVQTGTLRVEWRGSIDVHLNTDAEYEPKNLPAVVVTDLSASDDVFGYSPTSEYEASVQEYRQRLGPQRQRLQFMVESHAAHDMLSLDILSAIDRLIYPELVLPDLALGDWLQIADKTPVGSVTSVRSQEFVHRLQMTIVGKMWLENYERVPRVEQVNLWLRVYSEDIASGRELTVIN